MNVSMWLDVRARRKLTFLIIIIAKKKSDRTSRLVISNSIVSDMVLESIFTKYGNCNATFKPLMICQIIVKWYPD